VYPIVDLSSALYAFSFTFGLLMLMFRWRKLIVLFARLHIFAMWTFHLKSDDIVTPRYFADGGREGRCRTSSRIIWNIYTSKTICKLAK
jgi:hypothetical protein